MFNLLFILEETGTDNHSFGTQYYIPIIAFCKSVYNFSSNVPTYVTIFHGR